MKCTLVCSLAFAALFASTGLTQAQAPGMALVTDGQPRATIIISETATEKAKRAATELQAYIEKMSGAKLPITTDAVMPEGALISVGHTKLSARLDMPIPAGLSTDRRDEGYVIACQGDWLILAGNEDGPYHGTEYAVYDLLQRLGVRWFMPGEFGEIVPKRATITIEPMVVSEKPDFVMRNWWLHAPPELAEQERTWKLRNRMNPDVMFAIPGDSTARNVLPEAVYFKDHPEYFAMNEDGTRNPHLPNLTSPDAVRIAAETIKQYFRDNPEANSYGFAPDDGYPRDWSPETVALNQGFVMPGGREGVPAELSVTEEWIQFVNAVTAQVREEFPDAYIATNGYANRTTPPQGVTLDDHLVIMFAAIWSCTLHAYDDPHCWQKVLQGQMLKRWAELCPNVWIYGYNYQMLVSALTPLPEFTKLRRDFPLMKRWGVMGFWDESRNQWAESGIASRYLRARLEWDAEADVDAVLDDFFAQWYGPAAEPAKAFWWALDEAITNAPLHGHEDRMLPWVYTPELLARLGDAIARAEALADTDPVRTRVQADRLIYEHLRAYVAMSDAEAAGDFAEAARQAGRMMELRGELHAINPFFIWPDEKGYHTGIWYWGVEARKSWYQELASKLDGTTGEKVALLPRMALFRTDPHDEGIHAGWYEATGTPDGWHALDATKPFYMQGYADWAGRTYIGYMWYCFDVDVPASAQGRTVKLYLPVIETMGWVWVNGQYIAHRPYMEAYIRPLAMECDVTKALRPGASNRIMVRVGTALSPAQAAAGLLSRGFVWAQRKD